MLIEGISVDGVGLESVGGVLGLVIGLEFVRRVEKVVVLLDLPIEGVHLPVARGTCLAPRLVLVMALVFVIYIGE